MQNTDIRPSIAQYHEKINDIEMNIDLILCTKTKCSKI